MTTQTATRFNTEDRCLNLRPSSSDDVSGATVTRSSRSPRGTNATSDEKLNRSIVSPWSDSDNSVEIPLASVFERFRMAVLVHRSSVHAVSDVSVLPNFLPTYPYLTGSSSTGAGRKIRSRTQLDVASVNFKTSAVVKPTARSVRLRRRSVTP